MLRRKKRLFGTTERPRLVVNRSNRYIQVQLVDDSTHQVLLGLYDKSKVVASALKDAKTKTDKSRILGKLFAEKAKEKNISKIIFDRNGYYFHGRLKAFAEGAREGGLDF
jgi:large subunit ribosomal protein L18